MASEAMSFEEFNWHNNGIHGFEIVESEHGTGNLVLDIDYITEWLGPENGVYKFKIAPATLTFEGIFDLQISIDYKSCTAGITPPTIHEIIREPIEHNSYAWQIKINWPSDGYISFKAPGFKQLLRSEPIEHNQQVLPTSLRKQAT